ncbi:PREDICTED: carotenoid isomerooxygenase [Polistes dominula]|uniref:Carotenoid isomerooxygenase n=1 Tax=Polistes dominula TaxID=743375 RepID=A0ABM1IHA6_POLDO|nr:PREDICTED: carotenoid isomerooxygenase [Polistes dominula]
MKRTSSYRRSLSTEDLCSNLNIIDDLINERYIKKSNTSFNINNDTNLVKNNDTENGPNYWPNCDASTWTRSCEYEVIDPIPGHIVGKIPKWLKGTLLRNGPGSLKVGDYTFNHLFDSSALLHRFEISNGNVTYQRRFVQTEIYKKNKAAQRIVVSEFGTKAVQDPCQSIFKRVAAVFNPSESFSDNTMISVYPLGDEYYTFTESPVIHRIDPETLETKNRVNVSDYVNIVNHTSHPHVMNDGTVYNVGLSITSRGPAYTVVCFSPSRIIIDENNEEKELSMFDQAIIVATCPSRWLINPSYMHTFGITENYFIIIEQPLAVSLLSMMACQIKQEAMIGCLKWYEDKDTLIHVISKETGLIERTFIAETFFYLHIINQFETRDRDYIVLDICCYRDAKMLECMYIETIKNLHKNPDYAKLFRSRPLRFILPMKKPSNDVPMEYNLINVKTVYQSAEVFEGLKLDEKNEANVEIVEKNTFEKDTNVEKSNGMNKRNEDRSRNLLRRKATAHRLPDGNILVKPELLCDLGCETPRINYDSYVGMEYRYFYAISSDVDIEYPGTLIKVDTVKKTKKMWCEKNVYPSEPIFVPDPHGKKEDDGVIVSALLWSQDRENQAGLLILDAETFTEIARTTFNTPGPVPKCLHGWFIFNK